MNERRHLPKTGATEPARARLARMLHSAALAAWDGNLHAADAHLLAYRVAAEDALRACETDAVLDFHDDGSA